MTSVYGAPDLELRLVSPFACLHEARILGAGLLEKVGDVRDLLGHDGRGEKKILRASA
jgi:hypothetical protein